MYIPSKSGHVTHTIKNYVLGELKRYIRYNSLKALKVTFLKIRTKFFSRLRNRGFKKVWLRRHFATLKYEDREKLMAKIDSDSSSSHPEFQMVLERGGKPQNPQKSFGGQVSFPQRQQSGYRWKQDSFPHGTQQRSWRYDIRSISQSSGATMHTF